MSEIVEERAVIEAAIELRFARGEYDGEPAAVDSWLAFEAAIDALLLAQGVATLQAKHGTANSPRMVTKDAG